MAEEDQRLTAAADAADALAIAVASRNLSGATDANGAAAVE